MGLGSVCPQIWDEWKAAEPTDIRRQGSIIDLDAEAPAYRAEGFDSWKKQCIEQKNSCLFLHMMIKVI